MVPDANLRIAVLCVSRSSRGSLRNLQRCNLRIRKLMGHLLQVTLDLPAASEQAKTSIDLATVENVFKADMRCKMRSLPVLFGEVRS